MGKSTVRHGRCPACAAVVTLDTGSPAAPVRCVCGKTFALRQSKRVVEPEELEELEGPWDADDPRRPSDEYDLADDTPSARFDSSSSSSSSSAAAGTPRRSPSAARPAAAADLAALYPQRTARPAAEAAEPDDTPSPVKNLYVPLVMLALGGAMRVAQLLQAKDASGNQWWGGAHSSGGVGKALLLTLFEMIIASAIASVGAVAAGMLLGVDFGPPARAALKLCGAAAFATGVACWIALFDQRAYSVGGLMLALHAMIVIYWIVLGYLFSLDLQELIMTVVAIMLVHSVTILALWRGG